MTATRQGALPVLVFGAAGQVAREIGKIGAELGFAPSFAGRDVLDLSQGEAVEPEVASLIAARGARAVVNAAAYTAVDRAEQEPDAALRLNRAAAGAIARACAAARLPLVHISTDYVFDGTKARPYVEDDPTAPMGAYGRSKAEGETAVVAAGGAVAVVRTAWVYSAFGANFVKTMLRLAADREEVGVVGDQHGNPTWAADVAQAALRLARRLDAGDEAVRGVVHAAGGGEASWADFAEAIFEGSRRRGGPTARVRRITTADYPTPARRPANSRLSSDRLTALTGWRPPPWRESLESCLDELLGPARS